MYNIFKSKKTRNKELADAKALADAKLIIKEKEASEAKAPGPYCEIKALLTDDDGKIRIELDWDDNFINHLKKNGYVGVDEDTIIQKYILELTSMIADDMKGDGTDYD